MNRKLLLLFFLSFFFHIESYSQFAIYGGSSQGLQVANYGRSSNFQNNNSFLSKHVAGGLVATFPVVQAVKFLWKSIFSGKKNKKSCQCPDEDLCRIKKMSDKDLLNLYDFFLNEKQKLQNDFFPNDTTAFKNLGFDKLSGDAQQLLRNRFAKEQEKRDEQDRRQRCKYEQQKKVKEKKEQQAIKLSAYEETVELLKDNDFSNTAFDADGIYCFEKRESARIEAIKKVINGDKDVFLQTYQLSENTIQFLKNNEQQAFWYKTCRGNFLQQVVHQEFIDAISCCEQFTSNFNLSLSEHEKIKNLQNLILNISTTGCQYNQCGKIINAIRLSDVCWSLVDYGHAALQGIGEGIEDIAQLVLHPIKTVESLAHVVNLAASHLGMMIYDTCAVVGGKVFNTKVESNKNRLEQSYQTVIDLLSVAAYQVKNSSVRDLVRGGARFATTCILPGKCIKGIQKFFVSVKPQVVTFCNRLQDSEKVVVAVEGMNVNLAIQAANFTKDIVRKTVTTSKNGLKYGAKLAKPAVIRTRMIASTIKNRACIACKHLTQEYEIIFNQCCNGCKSSSKALVDTYKKGVPSFKNFVDQGLPLRGTSVLFKKVKLGLDETVLMKSLKVFVGKTIRSPGRFGQCLLPEYFVIDKEFLKHIFTGELEFFMNHKGIIKQKLSGFHYEGGLKTKMLELVDVIQDAKTGSYKGGLPFGGNKSMFPVHWSPKKVTEKIVEALGNIVSVEKEGAIFILKGTAKKGIKIEIVIKETGKLITAYPIV